MHKIKSAAKRDAWSNNDGTINLNPFGKLWNEPKRRSAYDEENALFRARSDGEALTTAEERRRSQYDEPTPPHHSSTMPVQNSNSGEISPTQPAKRDLSAPTETGLSQSNSEVGATTSQRAGAENEPVRRSGLLGKFRHKEKKEDQGVQLKEKKDDSYEKPDYGLVSTLKHTILNSWINLLLIAAPVGIALNYVPSVDRKIVFVVNFIAIIPLAAMLSYATEEIALRTSETIGGLLNASFGNAVELIVSIIALFDDEIVIVQTSLIGSMLSNLLLVMGMCFFFGGLNKVEQHFNVTVAQTASSLLALAVGSLIVPTVYNEIVGVNKDTNPSDNTDPRDPNKAQHLTQMSRGTSILLLLVYGAYLYFQLSTHIDMYNEPSKKAVRRKPRVQKGQSVSGIARMGAGAAGAVGDDAQKGMVDDEGEEEPEVPKLSLTAALCTLAGSTALVALCAEFMVDSISALTDGGGISKEFVGLILLPIVGNAAEHATAVTVAVKDKMDLAIGVAVGSSMQIALLVLPLVVTIGWMAGKDDMNLAFDGFQVIILFVTVLLVNYLIGDGKSHWLEGVLLNVLYLIIALAAWFYPTVEKTKSA